jgi:hypothetical protein
MDHLAAALQLPEGCMRLAYRRVVATAPTRLGIRSFALLPWRQAGTTVSRVFR